VKIVYRNRFPNDAPYEREFKGLQKYTTIAHLHPGWVQILRVDRNDAGRYFFCVMEPADDEGRGQDIDPKSYVPNTLSRLLRRRGRLPLTECVPLGLALTAALEHLHEHSLIHRDIKPSNVIFVRGAPKFADVGLITEMRSPSHDVSYVGTEGYMAPEGPGTPAADVYSLGKLLYEIAMGRDRREFPELSNTLLGRADEPAWQCFHEILFKACAIHAQRRYQSAAEMRAALLKLQSILVGQ
jgi:serine/threonine protein kinase